MVVVEKRPWVLPLLLAAWLVSLIIIALIAGYWATKQTREHNQRLAIENNQLTAELLAAQDAADKQRQEVMTLQVGSNIDKAAAKEVRHAMEELQSQITELQGEIGFYRSLMDPGKKHSGVDVGKVELFATAETGRVRFQFVVQQVAANHKLVTGTLKVNLLGREAGADKSIALKDVSEQISDERIKLKFKYFQNIEGEIILPEGFQPEWLEWELDSSVSGKSKNKLAWQIQEA